MSNIIYMLVLAALTGENTDLLEYELGERIKNHEVAAAIVRSVKQAIAEVNAANTDGLEDYEG